MKILLIGPLPPPVGGARVLFKQLVNDLECMEDINIDVIDIPNHDFRSLKSLFDFVKVLGQVLWSIPSNDVVSLHATISQLVLLGPIVWAESKLFGKKSVLRKFGGVFDKKFSNYPSTFKWFLKKTALNMDLLLFESKSMVAFFRDILLSHDVEWYPNNRPLPDDWEILSRKAESGCAKKFVFVGHVKPTKGVIDIKTAAEALEETIVIDVYGPLRDGLSSEDFADSKVNYCGELHPDVVWKTLRLYDVLLLPTYHIGEGYPGVILEAYCNGLPVIASAWNAIPEIVDEDSGILVEPRNVEALRDAMQLLMDDQNRYGRLRQGAIRKAEEFSSRYWSDQFVVFNQMLVEQVSFESVKNG